MIAVVDYGAGNLASVANALRYLDLPFTATADASVLRDADGILLPGVGAFANAMARLQAAALVDVLREEALKKPFLGICLGLQLLFDEGEEFGITPGLGLVPGRVRPLRAGALKLPEIGWNTVERCTPCRLSEGVPGGSWVYYVHSFCADTDPAYIALATTYGETFPAMVHAQETVYGCQFHPEKSGQVGLRILENFGRLVYDYSARN